MEESTTKLQVEFEKFRNECIRLRIYYNTYLHLFESGTEITEILEKTAHIFFHDLNELLIEYIFLQVGRITDPATTLSFENLTCNYFNEKLKERNSLSSIIKKHSDEMLRYRKLIDPARNKWIAHIDKDTALKGTPLGSHKKDDVASFFSNLQAYNDRVAEVLGLRPLDFSTNAGPGDVLDLIRVLKKAL